MITTNSGTRQSNPERTTVRNSSTIHAQCAICARVSCTHMAEQDRDTGKWGDFNGDQAMMQLRPRAFSSSFLPVCGERLMRFCVWFPFTLATVNYPCQEFEPKTWLGMEWRRRGKDNKEYFIYVGFFGG